MVISAFPPGSPAHSFAGRSLFQVGVTMRLTNIQLIKGITPSFLHTAVHCGNHHPPSTAGIRCTSTFEHVRSSTRRILFPNGLANPVRDGERHGRGGKQIVKSDSVADFRPAVGDLTERYVRGHRDAADIDSHHMKYLSNIAEQNDRAVERVM
jgi:hypothetical protein